MNRRDFGKVAMVGIVAPSVCVLPKKPMIWVAALIHRKHGIQVLHDFGLSERPRCWVSFAYWDNRDEKYPWQGTDVTQWILASTPSQESLDESVRKGLFTPVPTYRDKFCIRKPILAKPACHLLPQHLFGMDRAAELLDGWLRIGAGWDRGCHLYNSMDNRLCQSGYNLAYGVLDKTTGKQIA